MLHLSFPHPATATTRASNRHGKPPHTMPETNPSTPHIKLPGTVSKVPRLGEQSQNGSSVSSFEAFVHTYETCVYINESFVLTLCQTQSNFTPHIMRFMSDAMQVFYFRLVSPPETAAASHRRKCKSPCLSPSAPSKIVTCHTVTKQQHHTCRQAKAGT